jgi:predicted small lipoprotein YifL
VLKRSTNFGKWALGYNSLPEIQRLAGLARTDQLLYGGARALGIFDVTRNDRPNHRRWALILVGTAALLLSACGRKGPLDLPPTASGQQPVAADQPDPTATAEASKPSLFNPNYGSDQLPVAGKGPKRPFALDPLLNSN